MTVATPHSVRITDVGMRDGFQMESRFVPTDLKVQVAEHLIAAGIRRIEATSFVSPSAVPTLADADALIPRLKGKGAVLAALAPNRRGAHRAVAAGVDEIIVFVSASETHNLKNVNRTVDQSLEGLIEVADVAEAGGVRLNGVVATAFGCPFEGDIPTEAVLRIIDRYVRLGVTDITLGDTTGMATPPIVRKLCGAIADRFPEARLTLHFHNTRGLGLVNVMAGLELGIDRFEASIGGLGGCPFAPGATGNICTEDLIYMLDELGVETGVDLPALIGIAQKVEVFFGRDLPGQVMKAGPRLAA